MSNRLAIAAFASVLLGSSANAQDQSQALQRGAQAYRVCAACHSLNPGMHLSGPSLAGRWGEEAATLSGFGRYTDALKSSGIIWNENSLDPWIADPQAMVPGTTMTFRGVKEEKTRADLLLFLRQALAPGGVEAAVKAGLITQQMAQGPVPEDLSTAGDNRRIEEIRHCGDAYHVTTADGAKFPFWETNVRIKIDTSARGPRRGEPVLVRSGMVGDRVSVVFSSLDEMKRRVSGECAATK